MTRLTDALAAGPVVLDGGLGTLLEQRGHDLSGALWSAALLADDPDAVLDAHRAYFAAGARVAISASYQVTFEGSGSDAPALLRRSVELARAAATRDGGDSDDTAERWVAASVGPYGAMLADGSEYRGDYALGVDALRRWHRPRLAVLAEARPDVLAAETIPCLAEVEAIVAELAGLGVPGWISVTVDGDRLRSGEPLADAVAIAASAPEVAAVGVNCSSPHDVLGVIHSARSITDLPIVVYPNSGEQWDAKNRRWMGRAGFAPELVRTWVDAGASLIGGCCRVGPAQVAELAAALA